MELRHCRYFLAAHEAGNFTKAAMRLGISQPSLSQQIAQLEELLNVKLFDRIGRKIRLTSAGNILVPHARALLQAVEVAKSEVANSTTLAGGRLSIAYIPSLEHIVSASITEFMKRFPGIKIELRQRTGREIDRLILAGETDIGIAVRRVSPPEIVANVLYKEPYVLAFRQGHPLAKKKLTKLSAIGKTPFAIFCFGSFSRDMTDSYLSRIRFSPNICLEAESLDNLLSVVTKTDVCAVLPTNAVLRRDDVAHHRLINPSPTRSVATLTHQRGTRSPAAREFLTILHDLVGNEAGAAT